MRWCDYDLLSAMWCLISCLGITWYVGRVAKLWKVSEASNNKQLGPCSNNPV